MSDRQSGLFKLLCSTCRDRAPVEVGNEYRYRCIHHKAAVFESGDHRWLRYDEENILSSQRPAVIDNAGCGPFFRRG